MAAPFDVVLVADLARPGRPRADRSPVADVVALLSADGLRVGLLHREDPMTLRKRRTHVRAELQDLLDAGPAVQVYPEEQITTTLLCVLDAWAVLLEREPPEDLEATVVWVAERPQGAGPELVAEERLRRHLRGWASAPVVLGDESAPEGPGVGLLGQVRRRVSSWAP